MTVVKLAEMADRIMDVYCSYTHHFRLIRPTKGRDFRKIIWEKVVAALQTQERWHP